MARSDPRRDATDEHLVERAHAGSQDSYGELVRRHQSAALRLAAAICGSPDDACDVVQDAFVKGYRMLGQYRGEAGVRSWLLRIVANDAKNVVRARSRRRDREDRYEASRRAAAAEADPVGERVAVESEVTLLLDVLAGLGERDRDVGAACRFVAGLSEAETAVTLGVPRGTVKSRSARAIASLRERLDVLDAGGGDRADGSGGGGGGG